MNCCSVLAAKSLGDEAYSNFLDHTFLADRKTTIQQYLEKMGTSIMEEEPPESLKTRYGGWLYPIVATLVSCRQSSGLWSFPFLNLKIPVYFRCVKHRQVHYFSRIYMRPILMCMDCISTIAAKCSSLAWK